MKDYSIFVNSSYLITFAIIIAFGGFILFKFRGNSKKLAILQKNQNDKKTTK